jgi:hypothetical protein
VGEGKESDGRGEREWTRRGIRSMRVTGEEKGQRKVKGSRVGKVNGEKVNYCYYTYANLLFLLVYHGLK